MNMAENWEYEFLKVIGEALEEVSNGVQLSGDEDKPVLAIHMPMLSDQTLNLPLEISVEHILPSTSQIQMYALICSDVPEETITAVEKLLHRLNEFLCVGNFAIFYGRNQVFYNYGYVVDPETDAHVTLKNIGMALDIIMATVDVAYASILHVAGGTQTFEEILDAGIPVIQ